MRQETTQSARSVETRFFAKGIELIAVHIGIGNRVPFIPI